MTNLTDKWKKDELPSGWYYYKSSILGNITIADSSTLHKYRNRLDWKDIITILAKVPSYEEMQNINKSVNNLMAANIKLVEENTKLKELLKECKDVAEFTKTIVNKHKWFDGVIAKISQALGEDK